MPQLVSKAKKGKKSRKLPKDISKALSEILERPLSSPLVPSNDLDEAMDNLGFPFVTVYKVNPVLEAAIAVARSKGCVLPGNLMSLYVVVYSQPETNIVLYERDITSVARFKIVANKKAPD